MSYAQLGETTEDTHQLASLAFLADIPDGTVYVRWDFAAEGILTSRHFEECRETIAIPHPNQLQITPDNPHLTERDQQQLDDRGVVGEGIQLEAGDAIWSATSQSAPGRNASTIVDDQSERLPALWAGATVTEVDFTERRDRQEICVRLELHRSVAVGDALFMNDNYLGIVAGFLNEAEADERHPDAEIFASAKVADRLGIVEPVVKREVAKSQLVAAVHARMRRDGPYSLITQLPLSRGNLAAAQRVTVSHAEWLLRRGLLNILSEMMSIKADDESGRGMLRQFAEGTLEREDLPAPQAPVSFQVLQAGLIALGMHVDIKGGVLRIRPVRRDELLAVSNGEVKKPETLNYRTYEGEPDGLFCPTIFNDQLENYGHLQLETPIVPFLWRCGSPSPLEQLLSLTAEQIDSLLDYRRFIQIHDEQIEWSAEDASSVDMGGWLTGGEAIRQLLQRCTDKLPGGLAHGADVLTTDILIVLPSPMRPLIMLNSGNFATSDLNDLYRRIINRNNRLTKLVELEAPFVILNNERRMLQMATDALFANTLLPRNRRVMGSDNRPLRALADITADRIAKTESKPVTWSAQARAVADAQIPGDKVSVPGDYFEQLRLAEDIPVLLTRPEGADFVALLPQTGEAGIFRLPPSAAESLAYPLDEDEFLSLHVPLRNEAVQEGLRLLKGEIEVGPPAAAEDWLETLHDESAKNILSRLADAALHGEPARLDTSRAVLLAGLINER